MAFLEFMPIPLARHGPLLSLMRKPTLYIIKSEVKITETIRRLLKETPLEEDARNRDVLHTDFR